VITTAVTDQAEILRNIMTLHNDGQPFHADLTYSTGGFWKGLDLPAIRMDLADPTGFQNVQGDVRALPFRDGSLRSVVIDLPFIHAHGKESVMGKRFASYPSQRALDALHQGAAREIRRVLAPGGLLVWKCQDIIESGKQVWNHLKIHAHCFEFGLHAVDLFILVREHVLVGWNQHTQKHARRTHCYFWVFS
jgi:hypothetical protein